MHELSICTGLVEMVSAEMKRQAPGARVTKVTVAVGDLRQVVPESLRGAYEALVEGTPLAGSQLEIRHVPVTIRCARCSWEGAVVKRGYECNACGSGEVELMTGKELHLESLEIEEDGPQ